MKGQATTGNVTYYPWYKTVPLLPAITWSNIVQFLPHDAMRKRGLCCRPLSISVRLSVCLSVTFVNYIQTARDIVKILS